MSLRLVVIIPVWATLLLPLRWVSLRWWTPVTLRRVVWVVVLRRVAGRRRVVAAFGSLGKLVDGVDTTAGEDGSLDQSHSDE